MYLGFWWARAPSHKLLAGLLALAILALSAAAGARLYVLSFGRRRPWRGPATPSR